MNGHCFSLCFFVALFCAAISVPAMELYIAPNGSDGSSGAIGAPLKTLEAARDKLRLSGDIDKTVFLRAGRYERRTTFALDSNDNGKAQHPVRFVAYQKEDVYIDGGIIIPYAAVAPVTDTAIKKRIGPSALNVRQVDLGTFGASRSGSIAPAGFGRAYKPAPCELFIDNEPLYLARYPNAGQSDIPVGAIVSAGSIPRNGDYSMRPGIFKYVDPRVKRWTKAVNPCISGFFNNGFADDLQAIAKIDTVAGTITTALPHHYGFASNALTKWHALNLLEEIDLPGEYFADTITRMLYFYPPATMTSGSKIQLSMMADVMVAMENASYISFENLTFENTRGNVFYIENGTSDSVAGCVMRNIGGVAVQIGKGTTSPPPGRYDGAGGYDTGVVCAPLSRQVGILYTYLYKITAWNRDAGTNHAIVGCNIRNTGSGGIILGGGDRKTLSPGGNRVENCDIGFVNRIDQAYHAGVNIDGVGNSIKNNHIHDLTGQAVLLHGNNHVIQYNRINDVLRTMSDMGSIYMGRDQSECGSIISSNFLYNINTPTGGYGTQAIFFDDTHLFGATVSNNVFYKTGTNVAIKFNGAGGVPITNNIFVDCVAPHGGGLDNTARIVEGMKAALGQWRLFNQVDIAKEPYLSRYDCYKVYTGVTSAISTFACNYVVTKDMSQFVDGAHLNFNLKPGSSVYTNNPCFKPIAFDSIGLHYDVYRTRDTMTTAVVTRRSYPPPVRPEISCNGRGLLISLWTPGACQVSIIDMRGKTVFAINGKGPLVYRAPDGRLAEGLYFVSCITENSRTSERVMVVNR